MSHRLDALFVLMREVEADIETEIERQRTEYSYKMQQGRIVFEENVRRKNALLKQKLSSYLIEARPLVVLTAPVIYSVIIPFVILDLFVTTYQAICFPIYGIEKPRRSDFITFDRRHLSYLNGIEKLNCLYCSYGNGLLAYAREIAGLTERHWCPIKHAKRMQGMHDQYSEFASYGDAEGFHQTKE